MPSLNRDIANSIGVAVENDVITETGEVSGGVSTYATTGDMPLTNNSAGDQAFVTGNDRLYIWSGSGWYNIAIVNNTPAINRIVDSDNDSDWTSFALKTDGTSNIVTIVATDPEGFPITFTATTDSDFDQIATISQDSSVFTITPFSEDSAETGTGTITFTASDGVNIASAVRTFSLTFSVGFTDFTTSPPAVTKMIQDNDIMRRESTSVWTNTGSSYTNRYQVYCLVTSPDGTHSFGASYTHFFMIDNSTDTIVDTLEIPNVYGVITAVHWDTTRNRIYAINSSDMRFYTIDISNRSNFSILRYDDFGSTDFDYSLYKNGSDYIFTETGDSPYGLEIYDVSNVTATSGITLTGNTGSSGNIYSSGMQILCHGDNELNSNRIFGFSQYRDYVFEFDTSNKSSPSIASNTTGTRFDGTGNIASLPRGMFWHDDWLYVWCQNNNYITLNYTPMSSTDSLSSSTPWYVTSFARGSRGSAYQKAVLHMPDASLPYLYCGYNRGFIVYDLSNVSTANDSVTIASPNTHYSTTTSWSNIPGNTAGLDRYLDFQWQIGTTTMGPQKMYKPDGYLGVVIFTGT